MPSSATVSPPSRTGNALRTPDEVDRDRGAGRASRAATAPAPSAVMPRSALAPSEDDDLGDPHGMKNAMPVERRR